MLNQTDTNKPNEPLAAQAHHAAGRSNFALFIVLALLAGGGIWAFQHHRATAANAKSASPNSRTGPLIVPVVGGRVQQQDVPIYLNGIGTVQAFNSVTVRSRVDGQLVKIAFTEGQDVKAGDRLAQIDPDPFRATLAQAAAKKAQDEVQLANAQLDLKRAAEQLAAKIVAQQVYDTQRTLVNQLEAAIQADQAAIDLAKVQLAYTTITAPIDGRVGVRLVDQGNIVHANDATGIVVITQLHPISVVFTLPEQHLAAIQKTGTPLTNITIIAVDRDNTTVLGEGKLAVIDNQIDVTTGTLRLKATFPNDNLRLWPGQFVNARLLLSVRKNGVVVPAAVVQRGPDGPYAFVINPDQTVAVRPIKVAFTEAGRALIDSGLQPGEQVVVDGQYRLQPGSKIKLAQSAKQTETE